MIQQALKILVFERLTAGEKLTIQQLNYFSILVIMHLFSKPLHF